MTAARGMGRMAMAVLWPGFLMAALTDGLVFSLCDPHEVLPAAVAPTAAYTAGFLFFWGMGALASMLTWYLATVPEEHDPPF